MPRFIVFLLLAVLSGCGAVNQPIEISPGERVDGDLRSVNGSVRIGEEAQVSGNLSNVNGPIEVGERARVGSITNVNGLIGLQAGAEAGRIESVNGAITLVREVTITGNVTGVNGSIEIGESGRVDGDVVTVNGRLALGPDVRVAGKVANVRGKIELDGTFVEEIETTAGSIELSGATIVEGRLWVKAARNGDDHLPRIVIGPQVKVGGPLQFDRPVELLIHESAEVGEIIGAEPECFNCEISEL